MPARDGHRPCTGIPVKNANLTVTGDMKSHAVTADSRATVSHWFCPQCGSPILSATTRFPDASAVYAGSLDDPSVFKPQWVIYRELAQPWDHVDPQLID